MNFEVFVDWYQGLPPYLRAYWTIAIAMSIVFAIQMTLTLIGLGDTDSAGDIGDMDAGDADLGDGNGHTMDTGGAIQLFTIRNTINFLLGVGWGGVCLSGVIENRFLLAVAAFVCGCIMVCAFILMYKQLMKLEGKDWRQFNLVSLAGVYSPKQKIEDSKVPVTLGRLLEKDKTIRRIFLHLDK